MLLNLEEDHLDRHGTFEDYRDAKLRIFARQGEEDVAVAPPEIAVAGQGRRVTFGAPGSDLELGDGRLLWRGEPLLAAGEIRLRGAHNLENAMAAAAAALASGVPAAGVTEALRTFAGVPHRLEEVATVDGVLYVNDSKATNVAAAGAASRPSRAACTRSSAAASRAAGSRASERRWARAAAPAT